MTDDWVISASELQVALSELSVSATVEARRKDEPGSDVLVVTFSMFHVFLGWNKDHLVFGSSKFEGEGLNWFDNLVQLKNMPARALAIYTVARSLIFIREFVRYVGRLAPRDKLAFPIDQALLYELIEAQAQTTLQGYWVLLDDTSVEEDAWLTGFGQFARSLPGGFRDEDKEQ